MGLKGICSRYYVHTFMLQFLNIKIRYTNLNVVGIEAEMVTAAAVTLWSPSFRGRPKTSHNVE